MRNLIAAAGACAAILISAGSASAEERRIALLIGNEAYPEVVGKLENPHEDIDAVAVALTSAKFAPEDIILVKDGSKQQMLEATSQFMAKLREGDGDGVGFFYFSGHGASAETGAQRKNYLVPSDAEVESADQLPLYAIPLDSLIEGFSAIEAHSMFVISDACRNTLPIAAGAKSLGGAGNKGFTPVAMRPGLFVAYATADGATAPDDGVFGAAIARQIAKPNQLATRAFELAFRDVVQTRENAALPFVSPGLTQDFCFVSCPDDAPTETRGPGSASEQELADWRKALKTDTREAYLAFAQKYPDTFLGGEARAIAVLKPTAEEKAEARQVAGGDIGEDAVERTLQALESLAESLQGVARLGGIVDSPESITDYYNNARVYERRGDTLSARKMYERAIAAGADSVDIHYAYTAILKSQEGLIGAREIYADLARRSADNAAAQLAHATVLPGQAREQKLEALATDENYGPAYYELARLYSLDRLGQQTNADKDNEKKWLAAFRDADAAGNLQRWFLDDALLDDWREEVDRKWAAYEAARNSVPITFSASQSNSGWMITSIVSEAATAISYKLEADDNYRTLPNTTIDSRTGKPMPSSFFELPLGSQAQTILVKYKDRNGVEQGPFDYVFDPAAARRESDKHILKSFSSSWLSGRRYDGRNLLYFTHLMSYRCHLTKIEWGLSEDALDRTWPIEPCDEYGQALIGESVEIHTELESAPDTVYVRLTFDDGEQTDVNAISVRY